jgi:hypothetical protein
MQIIKKNESTADIRRAYLYCIDGSGVPVSGEDYGQPYMSVNGGDWVATTNTLIAIVDDVDVNYGDYYLELTQEEVNVDDMSIILIRYKSVNTIEIKANPIQIQEYPLKVAFKSLLDAIGIGAL